MHNRISVLQLYCALVSLFSTILHDPRFSSTLRGNLPVTPQSLAEPGQHQGPLMAATVLTFWPLCLLYHKLTMASS